MLCSKSSITPFDAPHLATEGPVLKIVGGKESYSSKYHMFLSYWKSLVHTLLQLHMDMATCLDGSLV